MPDKNEESIRDVVEYVIEEGFSIWTKLPKREASRRISHLIYHMIIANGYRLERPEYEKRTTYTAFGAEKR